MRYKAETDYDGVSAYAFEECAAAKVRSTTWTKSKRLALRHARAMAAVLRAAKVQHMARRAENSAHLAPNSPHFVAVFKAAQKRHALATQRLVNAVARLVAVEKEVKRG